MKSKKQISVSLYVNGEKIYNLSDEQKALISKKLSDQMSVYYGGKNDGTEDKKA